MKADRGGIIFDGMMWYVVVNAKPDRYDCICDNANNVYTWRDGDIEKSATLREIADIQWGDPAELDKFCSEHNRAIPYEVIVEVLSGRHDYRFD